MPFLARAAGPSARGSWSDQNGKAAWGTGRSPRSPPRDDGRASAAGPPGDGTGAAPGAPPPASDAEAGEPAWWLAEVVEHDRRRPGLAVPGAPPLTCRCPTWPASHISVQGPAGWPRVVAGVLDRPTPRHLTELLRLHVRAVPGGRVSTAPRAPERKAGGHRWWLGPGPGRDDPRNAIRSARGGMHRRGQPGLAPGQRRSPRRSPARSAPQPQPQVRLFFGARTRADLYDLARTAGRARPEHAGSLTVIPVAGGGTRLRRAGTGPVAEAAARPICWPGRKTSSSAARAAMMAHAAALVASAAPTARLHA